MTNPTLPKDVAEEAAKRLDFWVVADQGVKGTHRDDDLRHAAKILRALAQSQERDAELLSLRKDFEIVRTASRLFEQAAHDGLERALKAERATSEIRRAAIEECAKVAKRYADNPVGGPEQDSEDAFLNSGMTYTTGGADNASAIEESIRALAQQPTDGDKP